MLIFLALAIILYVVFIINIIDGPVSIYQATDIELPWFHIEENKVKLVGCSFEI